MLRVYRIFYLLFCIIFFCGLLSAPSSSFASYVPLTDISQLWGGGILSNHSCVLTSSGGVKCWGYNNNGQLGDGTNTNRLMPIDVSGLTSGSGVTAIAGGHEHTCALIESGGVKCWGNNSSGQLGDGTNTIRWTPVDVLVVYDTPPVAGSVSLSLNLSGTPTWTVSESLKGNYTYSDVESDVESGTMFQWYQATDSSCSTGKTAISGATAQTYTLVSSDVGKYICFGVTPKNVQATGTEVLATSSSAIVKLNQTITGFSPPASGTYGDNVTLSATGGGSSNAVTFSSTTTGICTVSGAIVSYVAPGTCTVHADQAGDANYNAAAQATGNINVTNPTPAPTYPLTNSTPAPGQTIQFDTPVGQKQTQSLTLKNFGSAALTFNSINTPVAPFSYPKPMPFTFIPSGSPDGSPQSFELSCTPTEMGLKTMTLQIATNDPDNPTISYPLECMGRLPVVVSSVANNSAVNFDNTLINSMLSQSITFTENGNTDLLILSATITGTNAADFAITAPTTFPVTIADGTTSSQIISVSCTPKTATPLTATLQVTTNDPANATLNYPLQCGGLFSLTLSTSGQGTIGGCGSSCVQNYQQDAVVSLSAVAATGWQFSNWSGCNGQVQMTGNLSCTANFTQIVENTTTPGTPATPTGTTTNPPTTTPTTNSGGGSGNAVSVTATAPVTNGVVDGAMSNYNQTTTNLTIPENSSVSGGILAGNTTNSGLAANVTVAPNSTITGGKLSGFNTNLGTLNNVTVSQYSEVSGGNYAGTTQNNGTLINPIISPSGTILNNGTIENPILLPGANVTGGKMTGIIIVLGGTYNSQVQPGTRVITRVQDIPPQMFNNFNAQTLNMLPTTIVSQITPIQFAQIPVESLNGLTSENMGAISPQVIQSLDKEQIQELNAEEFQAMPTEEVAKLLTNFDAEQITPQEAEKLLPQRWTIDQYGNLTAPPGTRISVRTLAVDNLPEGLKIPAIADLNSNFALGGKGSKTLITQMNQTSVKDSFVLSQQKTGVVHAEVAGAVGSGRKSQFAFMIDPEQIFLLDENALRGLQMNEQGQYIIVTEDGKQIPIMPMTKDPEQLLSVLGNNGKVDIQKTGEVLLTYGAAQRKRDGQEVYSITMFDPFIEPAPEDICTPEGVCDWSIADASMQPGLRAARNLRAKSVAKIVYPDGTAQQLYPTVLLPDTFIEEAKKFEGVEKIIFRMDGTFVVTYQGLKLLLIPDFDTQVQPIPTDQEMKASLILLSNQMLSYQVPYQGQLFTTTLTVTEALAP